MYRLSHSEREAIKFTAEQVEAIISKVVPLIAAPEDQEFFRGLLHVRASASRSSADFSYFISTLLKPHEA